MSTIASSGGPSKTGGVAIARDLIVRYGGEVVAVATDHRVLQAPTISVLERDHPRRRFVAALVVAGRELNSDPGEPYDDDQAHFFARILLMPNDEFEILADQLHDAELAEHFNVPLEQVPAKRADIDLG
jgi:hypothetical protein